MNNFERKTLSVNFSLSHAFAESKERYSNLNIKNVDRCVLIVYRISLTGKTRLIFLMNSYELLMLFSLPYFDGLRT